jgi:hypothetical protein
VRESIVEVDVEDWEEDEREVGEKVDGMDISLLVQSGLKKSLQLSRFVSRFKRRGDLLFCV